MTPITETQLDEIKNILSLIYTCLKTELLPVLTETARQAPGTQDQNQIIETDITTITVSMVDDVPQYRGFGPLYPLYGIRIFPEILPILGIDPNTLSRGENFFAARVKCLVNDNGNPKKIIGLSNTQPQAAPQPKPAPSKPKCPDDIPF